MPGERGLDDLGCPWRLEGQGASLRESGTGAMTSWGWQHQSVSLWVASATDTTTDVGGGKV